mmetsp:Transcript_34507/g.38650  ORF Transcript_34507/g.38650 Transcript_34507/m.38650 type:complete len:802 (+) Transcript_34507:95-2500(+)
MILHNTASIPSVGIMYPLTTNKQQKHRVLIHATCYNVLDGVTLTIRKIEHEILAQGHSVCILTTNSGNSSNTHMHMEGNTEHRSQQYQRYRHLPNKHPNRTLIFLDNCAPIPFLHDSKNPELSYHLGFSLSKDVKKKLDEYGPTIVHVTVPDVTCMHLIQYARASQLPLMGTYHSNIPDYFSHYPGIGWLKYIVAAYVRHQYNFLQALYVPTPFILKHLTVEEHYQLDKVTNLNVWGRGVHLEQFHPSHRSEDFRARFGFAPDDVVVIWVGRLVPEKRPDIFAYVVRRLAKEGVPFKALVVGAGPYEDDMKLLPNTSFTGWISGNELSVAYASSDIFLFPSAVETFGNVTLEAAASGLPLVVDSDCSGHLVQHGVNGFACKDGDLESYYNGTLCLVLDDLRRKSMSKDGRKFSLKFENTTVCRRMINNYTTITEEFYDVYGGNHANRDREYEMKEGSFSGGSYVRPTVLMLVEQLFIILFFGIYQISEFFSNAQKHLPFPRKSRTTASTVTTVKSSSSLSSSWSSSGVISDSIDSFNDVSSLPNIKDTSRKKLTTKTTTKRNELSHGLNSILEVEESINDSISYDSHQEVQSILSQPFHKQEIDDSETDKPRLITMLIKTDDDDTDSTDSSLHSCDDKSPSSFCSLSTSSNHRRRVDRLWRSELPVSHNIAILFIRSVKAQGRIECRIRKWCIRNIILVFSTKKITDVLNKQNRKRKGSEEITPDDYNSVLAMELKESLLTLHHCCNCIESSRNSDFSMAEEIDLMSMSNTCTCTEEGLNSRSVKHSRRQEQMNDLQTLNL